MSFFAVWLAIGRRHVAFADHTSENDHRGDVRSHEQKLGRDVDVENGEFGRE